MFSSLMKKSALNEEDSFAPQKIEMKFAEKTINMKKTKKR